MKELAYKIANGQIENPSITLELGGGKVKFDGREAKIFCYGYLAGLKAAEHGISVDDRTTGSD